MTGVPPNGIRAFKERAADLGRICEYEADSGGRVYAIYENTEILPIGVVLPSLAGKSKITPAAFDHAVREAVGDA